MQTTTTLQIYTKNITQTIDVFCKNLKQSNILTQNQKELIRKAKKAQSTPKDEVIKVAEIGKAEVRSRAIEKKLKNVDALPATESDSATQALLDDFTEE